MAAREQLQLQWQECETARPMVCAFGKQGETDTGGVELSLLFSLFSSVQDPWKMLMSFRLTWFFPPPLNLQKHLIDRTRSAFLWLFKIQACEVNYITIVQFPVHLCTRCQAWSSEFSSCLLCSRMQRPYSHHGNGGDLSDLGNSALKCIISINCDI